MDGDVEDGWLLLDSDIAGYQEEIESNDDIDLTTASAEVNNKKNKGIFGFGLAKKMQKMFNGGILP